MGACAKREPACTVRVHSPGERVREGCTHLQVVAEAAGGLEKVEGRLAVLPQLRGEARRREADAQLQLVGEWCVARDGDLVAIAL